MPIDFAKYGLPVRSLNSKEVMNSRMRGQKWPPACVGKHKVAVCSYKFSPPADKRTYAFMEAEVEILESDATVFIGRRMPVSFILNGDPKYQDRTDADRASFVAACGGGDSQDPRFDCDAEQDQLLAASDQSSLGFDEAGVPQCVIWIESWTKDSTKAEMVNGVPTAVTKTYVNFAFSAFTEETAP